MINKENLDEYIGYFNSYFGRSPDYYIERVKWYFNGKNNSFNIYAFFLGVLWLLFRKMYRPAFFIILIVLLFTIIEEIMYSGGVMDNSTYSYIIMISYLILPALIGCFSNRIYIRRSIKIIESSVRIQGDPVKVNESLRKKGGTSLIAPLIFLIIVLLSNLALQFKQ